MRRKWGLVLCVVAMVGCVDIDPLGPSVEPAQKQYGTLEGTVELIDGGVASGITAELQQMESCFLCGWPGHRTHIADMTANVAGTFRLEHLEAGSYVVNLGGYQDYFTWGDRDVQIRPNEITTVRYVIKRLSDPLPGKAMR